MLGALILLFGCLLRFSGGIEHHSHPQSHGNNTSHHILKQKWLTREIFSKIGKQMKLTQEKCNTLVNIYPINNYGMGSGLISLSKAFCNTLEQNSPLHVIATDGGWIWNAAEFCRDYNPQQPMTCYFGDVFKICSSNQFPTKHIYWQTYQCPSILDHETNLTAQFQYQGEFAEYLFSKINPEIVKKAESAALEIFGDRGAPDNMITIHIRWGDKGHEMGGLLPIESYIRGVEYFVQKHALKTVHIFLTTEDIKAATAFKDHPYVKSKQWKIYEYVSAISNMDSVHTPALDAKDSKGVHGLLSMIVLLLSMESKYYIVTTASNWSGIIAALRSGIVDPDCNGCTDWIDLRFNPLLRPGVQAFNKQAGYSLSHKDCPYYPYNSEGHLLYPADCHHYLPKLSSQ